ncbi:MAG: SDR family oxidoreductase [Christensenellaceae bacterium]|jgi:NAD(P)-dependent dehydrogenase (short-subunit alcohol dehydrogenase family)|nr:SDR family oxidoreductase [Christensenellaceae bacterium]
MGKTAIVTGASHNIGQGIAIVLAEHGYDVAITYKTREEGANDTKAAIEKLGRKCYVFQASLEEAAVPEAVVNKAHEALGHIDLIVCNAGRDVRGSVLTSTAEDLEMLYTSNYRNYVLCAGAAARHMVKDGTEGCILFITSSRAEQAYPDDFLYGGFKAAIKRAASSMAIDLSHYNIRVNCVAPGATWTPRPGQETRLYSDFVTKSIPLHRVGNPRENGEVCAFLASEHASYITGITVRVDGGLILPGMLEGSEHYPWVRPGFYDEQAEKLKNWPV